MIKKIWASSTNHSIKNLRKLMHRRYGLVVEKIHHIKKLNQKRDSDYLYEIQFDCRAMKRIR